MTDVEALTIFKDGMLRLSNISEDMWADAVEKGILQAFSLMAGLAGFSFGNSICFLHILCNQAQARERKNCDDCLLYDYWMSFSQQHLFSTGKCTCEDSPYALLYKEGRLWTNMDENAVFVLHSNNKIPSKTWVYLDSKIP